MTGRGEWIRGALVVVVIAAVLGVFGAGTKLQRPDLSALNIAGLAAMVAGLLLSVCATPLAGRAGNAEKREKAALTLRLLGVLVCGAGAAAVFL